MSFSYYLTPALSLQNGLMLKITETCPELNCTLGEQILPDGRCCNVCRGTSLCDLEWLGTDTPIPCAGERSKHTQFAFCTLFLLSSHVVWLLLGLNTQKNRLGCRLWSSCFANLPVPHCFGGEVLQSKKPSIIQLIHRINRPMQSGIYGDTTSCTERSYALVQARGAEGVGYMERRSSDPGMDNWLYLLLSTFEDFIM